VAGNKGPHGRSVTPSPAGVGRRMERRRQKKPLLGQGKGSLTEQQMKRTVTTTSLIRRIYKTKQRNAQSNSHRPMPCVLLRCD